ncbi:hypothetical protein MSWHS_2816 [Methanosarcina sp. WWM596]|nr:hypothetical protein MSWHS_2816 [Methanosarcina sp. WWM596]
MTSDYKDDATCIQAALDNSKSGDTITIREGDYYITKRISQKDKSLNIIGEGKVTLHLKTAEGNNNIRFAGSKITTQSLSANAQKGSSKVILSDASQVRQNDLIKIWKNVQWCPLDYPNQMTGEIYAVQSVNGNVVTLNQPLLRDYKLSETVQAEIYRPIEMHIKNIGIQNVNAAGVYEGIKLSYCKDSSVTDSWFKDNGQASLRIDTCFNVDVKNNEIYNSIHEGNGYGISVADAAAFVNIENNHIENCRHAIMSGTGDFKALNRDIVISNNILIGANIASSHVIDAHPMTIDYTIIKNKIYPETKFVAFYDGTLQSIFSENEVYGGHGAVARRCNLNDGVHVIKGNHIETEGYLYAGTGNGIGDTLVIMNNNQNNGQQWYGVGLNSESFRNIVISKNHFGDLSGRGVDLTFHIDDINLEISDNTFENIRREGIYLDGNSYTNGNVKIQNNNLINVYPSSPGSEIKIKNIQNAFVSGNQILEEDSSVMAIDEITATETVETEVATTKNQTIVNNTTNIVIDNRLREASPDVVYQDKKYIDIGGNLGVGRYRGLLLFDLSEYINAENISSSTLSLYWYYPDGRERPGDTIVEIYRPAASWSPGNVTWNSRDAGVLWTQPGGDWFDMKNVSQGDAPYATITLNGSDIPDNRYYELNVTDLVREYVSGEYENTGFLIKARTENADYVAFYSSEIEEENKRPILNIEENTVA